jgi:putative inorganic carbon (HCO3(-)) transporter
LDQYVYGAVLASGWLDARMFSSIGVRVFSTLENPNVLAQYLLLVIPFALAAVLVSKGGFRRLFLVGCLAAMVLCMVFTFARGGWLGLIASMAVFLVMLDRRFIVLGAAALVALYFLLPDVILNRFLSIGNVSDTSTAFRVFIWLGTLSMLRDFWFTGIGPGTVAFNKVYPLYSFNAVDAPHAHNLYLQIMCDTGVCGFAVFVFILFSYFRNLCHAISKETDRVSKILQIAAVSGVLGFLVQGMTDYSFYNYRVTLAFWTTLGLGALCARRGGLPTSAAHDGGASAPAGKTAWILGLLTGDDSCAAFRAGGGVSALAGGCETGGRSDD